ncbi:hypothetical protein [Changchengzhania lutea]|uniref:hypothetical protein n=1 Tax=Changchengzhania lutea TaxID=2049305 RepID=UPI00163D8DA9|nr:hypothetical protein [Changchengzhania lutea]
MKTVLLFVVVLMFVSCSNDDSNPKKDVSLIGSWKLIEQLTDPGDGSGVFTSVNT